MFVYKGGEGGGETGPGVDSGGGEGEEERDQKAGLQYARPDECSLLPNFSPSFYLLELLFPCLLPPYDPESWTLTAGSCCKGPL